MLTTQQNLRLDYLDAARAIALILGIIFHASISFLPIFIGWAVMDISTSSFVSIFMMISHSFRLELFFLVAGFFSHMKFHREGTHTFLKSRIVRIALPFVVGWILLRPLIVAGWTAGAESMRGEVNFSTALQAGFASLSDLPKDFLTGTHLWFLYYLLVISAIVLLLKLIVTASKPIERKLVHFADLVVKWACHSRLAIIAVAIPTACCLWFMNSWGMDTPDKSLVPHIPTLLVYTGFFIFGWLLHRQELLMEGFASLRWEKVALCLLSIVSSIIFSSYQVNVADPQYWMFKTGFVTSYAIMMWSLVSLSIGICKRLLDRPSKFVRYIADSSYRLYLIHLPIVIFLQIAFAEMEIHWVVKWVSISGITILLSLIIYDLFIRSTFVGQVLNGKRKSRLITR
jgi:peptidoglycan/LPS O-acetylase OafA/YrhL